MSNLKPNKPGPLDLLSKGQLERYMEVYREREGTPLENHHAAWEAALKDTNNG